MRRTKLSKEMKDVRNKKNYDISSIINDMKIYYSSNNFDNETLLERLHQLKLDKLYIDSFHGAMVGLFVGLIALASEVGNSATKLIKDAFTVDIFYGFVMMVTFLIIIIILASFVLGAIKFIKFTYYKIVKSAVLGDFLDEKEGEIINQILNERIE